MSKSARLPDFVVVGAAKSGTTSLYNLLNAHDGIFMPERKEPEFFARDDHYAQGIDSYAKHFSDASPDQIIGECSTIYSLSPLFPDTAARMSAQIPDAKIIYFMRQPVNRAYSFYVQIIKNYQNVTNDLSVHRTFEEFIDPDQRRGAAPREKVFSRANDHLPDTPELCLAGSDYLMQIDPWLANFPRDQILFLKFEDFVRDRPATLRKVTDFLGVAPLDDSVFDRSGVTRNIAANHFRRRGQERAIKKFRNRFGSLWALRRILPKGWKAALKSRLAPTVDIDTSHVPPKMTPETHAALTARFRAQQQKLEAITGLDTAEWWTG